MEKTSLCHHLACCLALLRCSTSSYTVCTFNFRLQHEYSLMQSETGLQDSLGCLHLQGTRSVECDCLQVDLKGKNGQLEAKDQQLSDLRRQLSKQQDQVELLQAQLHSLSSNVKVGSTFVTQSCDSILCCHQLTITCPQSVIHSRHCHAGLLDRAAAMRSLSRCFNSFCCSCGTGLVAPNMLQPAQGVATPANMLVIVML